MQWKSEENISTQKSYYKFCQATIIWFSTLTTSSILKSEWVQLNFNQCFTSRQTNFVTNFNSTSIVGKNDLSNRFHELDGRIDLNQSLPSYKIECKKLFLTNFDWTAKILTYLTMTYILFVNWIYLVKYITWKTKYVIQSQNTKIEQVNHPIKHRILTVRGNISSSWLFKKLVHLFIE
jgi:hypothetical protein